MLSNSSVYVSGTNYAFDFLVDQLVYESPTRHELSVKYSLEKWFFDQSGNLYK